jgi:hypothetical protein
MDKQIATVVKAQGLCNRIKTYISAICEYDEINTQVFADSYIFPSFNFTPEIKGKEICDWRLKVFPEEEKYIDDYKTIDMLYEKVPQYFVEKYTNIINNISINPDILEYVEDFTKNWDDNVIGVHVRTWWLDAYKHQAWHDNSLFEEQIEKFPNDVKIFLCSDNPNTILYFTKKYGDRIITHPQKLHKSKFINPYDQYQDDVQLVVDGFIDCLILSKCNTIIGSWWSTFTECAWWFGKCKAKVIIPEPLNYDVRENEKLFLRKDG